MSPKPRRALLVLGMHRSGTSAVTRVLSLRGAALPAGLVKPSRANERGFWEPSAVAELQEEMLRSAGSAWDDARPPPAEWFSGSAAPAFAARLRQILEREYGHAPLLAIKDPRTCRLLPVWRQVLGEMNIEPLAVLPVRNPLEVAGSLERRDGMPKTEALALWLEYVLAAERGSRGLARTFVAYPALLHDWRAAMGRMARDLALSWPDESAASDAAIDAFLTEDARRNRASDEALAADPQTPATVKLAYRWLCASADGKAPDPLELDVLDRGRPIYRGPPTLLRKLRRAVRKLG